MARWWRRKQKNITKHIRVWANLIKIYIFYFILLFTSSSPYRKDQFTFFMIFYKLLLYLSRSTTGRSGTTQRFVAVDLLIYIYIYFLLDLCVYRKTVVRGESRTEYLWKRPCYSWCYSCKKLEASSINTELERLLKIVGSSYSHSLPERSLHFHSLYQPNSIFLFI